MNDFNLNTTNSPSIDQSHDQTVFNIEKEDRAVILVIDDDALMLTAVAAALHLAGHEAHCARDCEAAIKAVRGLTLDLVVCDIEIGNEDGFAFWQELQQEPNMADTPVVFVSERPSADILDRVHAAGGFYYLNKPYNPNEMLELVDKALWMPHLINTHISHSRPHMNVTNIPASMKSIP